MKNIPIYFLALLIVACHKKGTDPNPNVPNGVNTIVPVCDGGSSLDTTGAHKFGNGTSQSCTEAALQTLLTAGGTIVCNCGNDPFTLKLSQTLQIGNVSVIIDGRNKFTLDGGKAVRIFDKIGAKDQPSGTLFGIQNLNLINGLAASNPNERGGAAFLGRAFGSLFAYNVQFNNNSGPLSASDDCGAVHTILYKSVKFINCIFTNNVGANGGAVGTIGSGMEFYNCNFDHNQATGTGGTFDKGGSGGAIYVDGTNQNGDPTNNKMTLCNCKFTNNTAGYQAGALNIVFYASQNSTASVDKCSFENNTCSVDKGGAYYHENGPLILSNSTFYNNSSPVQGGGLWCNNTNLNVSNCTFDQNIAKSGTIGQGGALAILNGTSNTSSAINCTFAENAAGDFGTAIFNSGELTLTNTLFYNNGTGNNPYAGNVINKGSNLTVGNGNLQYPKTYTGIYGTQADNWITSSVITDNPMLQLLADNGGPTKTMALPGTSPAVDKGTSVSAPLLDQRGLSRKGNVDIGAFELQ